MSHKKQISPPCWKENLWYSFQQVRRKNVCQGCTNLSTNSVNKNFYIQICVLSIESVTKICRTNVHKFVHKICPEFITKICPQILSTRSANLSTIITNLFQSVYSVSRNLSTKESTNLYTICHYSGNNLSLFWNQFVTILLSGVHKYTLSSVG